jgi:hypothetical protein
MPSSKTTTAWVTLCVSTYPEDIAKLDALVKDLRARGHRRVSRSSAIRTAVATLAEQLETTR